MTSKFTDNLETLMRYPYTKFWKKSVRGLGKKVTASLIDHIECTSYNIDVLRLFTWHCENVEQVVPHESLHLAALVGPLSLLVGHLGIIWERVKY